VRSNASATYAGTEYAKLKLPAEMPDTSSPGRLNSGTLDIASTFSAVAGTASSHGSKELRAGSQQCAESARKHRKTNMP